MISSLIGKITDRRLRENPGIRDQNLRLRIPPCRKHRTPPQKAAVLNKYF